MQSLACTQSAQRSQCTACEKEIFEEDMLPVAKEHSWKKTYTHTPTHDALSILKKLEQRAHTHTHARTHTRSFNQSLSYCRKEEATFQEHHCLIYRCVCVCVSVCVSVSVFKCLCALFVCIEGSRHFSRTTSLLCLFLKDRGKLCQSVNQILPQMQFSTSWETDGGREKQTPVRPELHCVCSTL